MGRRRKIDEVADTALQRGLAEQREIVAPLVARLAELDKLFDELAQEREFQRTGVWDKATQPPLPFEELGEE